MSTIWKSDAGRDVVLARYRDILTRWPVPREEITVPTRHGETFIIASGPKDAPVLFLHHGSAMNSVMWMGDVAACSEHFRVYCVDMIGEPGFSSLVRPSMHSAANAEWVEDVWSALGVTRANMSGTSLGGWLSVDFAARHPEKVSALALVCPAGIGKQINFLAKAWPYLLLGKWGRQKMRDMVLGKRETQTSPGAQLLGEYIGLIHTHFKPRFERLPQLSDADLKRLTMPMTVYAGAKDVLIDSADTKRRLNALVPSAEIHFLPEAGHFIPSPTAEILVFLRKANGV